MGWSFSMVVIDNIFKEVDEVKLFNEIGLIVKKENKNININQAMTLNLKSKNLFTAYYNNCLIIIDNLNITEYINPSKQFSYSEARLVVSFPKSKILSLACASAVNALVYSIISNKTKVRYNNISDMDVKTEFGEPTKVEQNIYNKAKFLNNQYVWEEGIKESEMYEEFAFELLNEWIGVRLDKTALLDNLLFSTFKIESIHENIKKLYVVETKNKKDNFITRLKKNFLLAIVVTFILVFLLFIIDKLINL